MLAHDYPGLLAALLPTGAAWPQADKTSTLYRLLAGLAAELAIFDSAATGLLTELDPRSTVLLLLDWQRELGLPDGCLTASSLQEWQNLLHARLTATGGSSIGYFLGLAASLGYFITISENKPFRADVSLAGDPLNDGPLPFTWTLNVVTPALIYFRAGISLAGERLEYSADTLIECLFNKLKPAHTTLVVNYLTNVLTDENGAPVLDEFGNFILLEI